MKEEESEDSEKTDEENEEELFFLPEEFHFSADTSIHLDPRLLQFHHLQRQRKGKRGGKRHRRFNLERGRFVRAIFPPAGSKRGRLAVGATLRAAAPYQKSRRQRQLQQQATAGRKKSRRPLKVYITKDDFRVQQLKKKTGSLIIFVVDASGSMALNRMSAAKG